MPDLFWRVVENEGQWRGEMTLSRRDGSPYVVWFVVRALKDMAGSISHYVFLFIDITDRKRVEDRLRFLSYHDALTGLPNRILFRERLEQALTSSRRSGSKIAVMFLDLDGFKHINDRLGHEAGDEMLKQVGTRLQDCLRAVDTAARFGGDEFAVILLNVKLVKDIEKTARALFDALSAPYRLGADLQRVTASIGITVYPDDGPDIDSLMRFADQAMYQAKSNGKDAYQFYTQEMTLFLATRLALMSGVGRAVANGEFVVYYQPQIDIQTGYVRGLEALVRWRHPEMGLIPPVQFIGFAEESGFILPLGEHVLRQACAQLAAWHAAGMHGLKAAVNLSGRQFRHHDVVAMVRRALADARLPATSLELEVTESAVIEDIESASRVFTELRELGVQTVLDDFGTGHASMAYLKRLPFDQLKIDRQFVNGIERDAHNAAIATAIIHMAHALGMTVVAEGVETAEELSFLDSLGCKYAQGYFTSPPLPAQECARRLFELMPPAAEAGPTVPTLVLPAGRTLAGQAASPRPRLVAVSR